MKAIRIHIIFPVIIIPLSEVTAAHQTTGKGIWLV